MESTAEIEVGQELELTITDLAFGGEGVGRLENLVVFVYFVIPGERVKVRITEKKKNFARAVLVEVLEKSSQRVEPRCTYFGECGGCQYQHIDYPSQVAYKTEQVRSQMSRMGGLSPDLVKPVVPCPAPFGYRNRIMIRSQWNKFKQGLEIGFIRYDNRLVVDIDHCPIAEPALNDQIKQVRANPPPKGGIKVVLRVASEDYEVPQDSFFQNNFFLLPQLVSTVRGMLSDAGSQFLIDAYCGVGFFGIEMASVVKEFVGVEFDHQAIKAARRNAEKRSIANGQFVQGRTEVMLSELLQKFPASETTLILDPPRTGCPPESLELLKSLRLRQILYVSCHPSTLARDLAILSEGGTYKVKEILPLDMFPQTQHVECVADVRGA